MRGSMTKRSMGELERAVMDILWDQGGWLTPGEVHQRLQDPPAYTTVMTILVRLCTKGRVERHRDGRAYAYHPVVTREQFLHAGGHVLLAGDHRVVGVGPSVTVTLDPALGAQADQDGHDGRVGRGVLEALVHLTWREPAALIPEDVHDRAFQLAHRPLGHRSPHAPCCARPGKSLPGVAGGGRRGWR